MKIKLALKVIKGALVPADSISIDLLKNMNLKIDDIIIVEVKPKRSYKTWGMLHKIGEYIEYHIEKFIGKDAHEIIKDIQLEGNIYCEETVLQAGNGVEFTYKVANTLSFDELDSESKFRKIMDEIIVYIIFKYFNNEYSIDEFYDMCKSFDRKKIV